MVGKDRLNWQVDPPPDLVIEIDVTSYTAAGEYSPYQVPEVWLYKMGSLQIHGLQAEGYALQSTSRYFPGVDLTQLIAAVFQMATEQGTGMAIRALRQRLCEDA